MCQKWVSVVMMYTSAPAFWNSGVVVGANLDFGRAVEGEGGRHEDDHRPLALQAGFGDFDELAVVESLGLERLQPEC